jgi:KUP system potassium uptake protein
LNLVSCCHITKFAEGGYVTLFIAIALISIKDNLVFSETDYQKLYKSKLKIIKNTYAELSTDLSIPKYAMTHLVYMTNASRTDEIEEKVIKNSYFAKDPKGQIYTFGLFM